MASRQYDAEEQIRYRRLNEIRTAVKSAEYLGPKPQLSRLLLETSADGEKLYPPLESEANIEGVRRAGGPDA